MTGKERALAAIRGQPHDRTPVVPIVGQAAAALCGVSIREHAHNPELLARCQVECARRFGYDGVYIAADTWVTAEALGFPGIEHPENAPAGGKGAWIRSADDLACLRVPDPRSAGRWPVMIAAVRHAVRLAGDDLLIIANFDQSPFSLACQLRDINQFMIDLSEAPDFAGALLQFCAQAVSAYALALAEAGAHLLNTGDSPAGLIGPELYERFALPYERSVFHALRQAGSTPISLHICGDSRPLLSKMIESGADAIEIDHAVELACARRAADERVTLIGNVDPVGVLLRGSPDNVRQACRRCREAMAGSNRFILSTGCAISPLTPPANLAAMLEP